MTEEEAKAEPEKKESKKENKFQDLGDWLAEATQDVP